MMNQHDTGGTAFPVKTAMFDCTQPDMTLRDYFAAKALAGFCASPRAPIEWLRDHCAVSCYQMADAMLKARQA